MCPSIPISLFQQGRKRKKKKKSNHLHSHIRRQAGRAQLESTEMKSNQIDHMKGTSETRKQVKKQAY